MPVTLHLDGSGSFPDSGSVGFPPGFGGWNLQHCHRTAAEDVTKQKKEQQAQNQCKVYLGWVNGQLRKKKDQDLIEDISVDMTDGTIFAAVIEVLASEKLKIISAPSLHAEKVSNMNQVLRFMKANRIPMHPISAEEIVSGDIRSIMRLILALAARYRPNTVRQTSKKNAVPLSVVSYAQSAVEALTEARRNASIVVPKPQKPSSLNDHSIRGSTKSPAESISDQQISRSVSRSSVRSSKSSQPMPKSSSQDFSKYFVPPEGTIQNDAKYKELVGRHQVLRSDHEDLMNEHGRLQSIYSDVCTEVKILRISLASLRQLLEGDEDRSHDARSSSSEADDDVTSADVASLKNQLVLSEEICSDVKEDLSKTRNKCLRLEGAEVGLHQRLRHQQNEQFSLKAELKKSTSQIQLLLSDKSELERQLLEKDSQLTELACLLSMPSDVRKAKAATSQRQMHVLNEQGEYTDNSEANTFRAVLDAMKRLRSQFKSDNPCCETVNVLEEAVLNLIKQLQMCECTNRHKQDFITNQADNNCDSGRRVIRNDGQSR